MAFSPPDHWKWQTEPQERGYTWQLGSRENVMPTEVMGAELNNGSREKWYKYNAADSATLWCASEPFKLMEFQ